MTTRLSDLTRITTILFALGFLSLRIFAAETLASSFITQELSRARTDPDNRVRIEVRQPLPVVFDALLTRLAEYSEDIKKIEFDHSNSQTPNTLGVGSLRITTMEDGSSLVQRILVLEPDVEFAYFTDMSLSTVSVPITYSIGHYAFSEQDDGSVAAAVSVVYKPSSRLTAFLVRIGFNRALARDFANAESFLNSLEQ